MIAGDSTTATPWNAETESYEEPEVLYRSESGSPILVMCPNEDWIPDTEVVITDSSGTVTIWSPYLDPSYRISALRNDNGESLIFDFTSYDELPAPGCGNDQWIAEVTEESGDPVYYSLTLLEDGTLLLQIYWEMDGMPMVSYGWYARVD